MDNPFSNEEDLGSFEESQQVALMRILNGMGERLLESVGSAMRENIARELAGVGLHPGIQVSKMIGDIMCSGRQWENQLQGFL